MSDELRLSDLPVPRRAPRAPPRSSVLRRVGPGGPGLRAFIREEAWNALWAHVRAEPSREAGGLLAGLGRRGLVVVHAALPAEETEGGPGHLTFTPEAWRGMADRLEEALPAWAAVGWFHSHPGIGVSPSGKDLFLHTRFFPEEWQVALIVDPAGGGTALYRRRGEGLAPATLEIFSAGRAQAGGGF
ncbi:MAG: Mov34/MPN/PAD-1 family protein [Halobacteria archaeon]